MKFVIYSDGATSNNGHTGALGGWAAVILAEDNRITDNYVLVKGSERDTTNQRMELTGCLEGLKKISEIAKFADIDVYTDSAYLCNCFNQKWYSNWERNGWLNSKKQPVANKDLWEQLVAYFRQFNITFYKVKGHAGDHWNEICDTAAVQARQSLERDE